MTTERREHLLDVLRAMRSASTQCCNFANRIEAAIIADGERRPYSPHADAAPLGWPAERAVEAIREAVQSLVDGNIDKGQAIRWITDTLKSYDINQPEQPAQRGEEWKREFKEGFGSAFTCLTPIPSVPAEDGLPELPEDWRWTRTTDCVDEPWLALTDPDGITVWEGDPGSLACERLLELIRRLASTGQPAQRGEGFGYTTGVSADTPPVVRPDSHGCTSGPSVPAEDGWQHVDTFEPHGRPYDEGGTYSQVLVRGKLVRVEPGYWSNAKQDWYARLVYDTGQVVNSSGWYKDYRGGATHVGPDEVILAPFGTPRESLIDALHEAWQDGRSGIELDRTDFEETGDALIRRLASTGQAPDGYVLVPTEPTEAMVRAGAAADWVGEIEGRDGLSILPSTCEQWDTGECVVVERPGIWAAMLAASQPAATEDRS